MGKTTSDPLVALIIPPKETRKINEKQIINKNQNPGYNKKKSGFLTP